MSDVEEMLRNELRDLAGRPQPEPITMLRRVRRARRRGAIAGAAMALLVLVAGAFVWLGRDPAGLPPADPPSLPALSKLSKTSQLHFVDPDHGFALAQHCRQLGDLICTPWLASTSDGGRSWQAHEVTALKDKGIMQWMRVFDRNRVTLEIVGDDTRWYTGDAGRTWKQMYDAGRTIDHIPPLAQAQPVSLTAAQPLQVIVHLPDGTTARLAAPPTVNLTSAALDATIGKDDSVWIQGNDDTRGRNFVSRDRGRTWAEVPLPAGVGKDTTLRTYDGRHAYVTNRYAGSFGIWRTTDDGKTWQQLQLPLAQPKSGLDLPICPTLDGGLFLSDYLHGKEFRIGTTGLTFGPPAETTYKTCTAGSRYIRDPAKDSEMTIPFDHSADGETWTELRF